MSKFHSTPSRGFGYEHMINFGKTYKDRTYYDVANEGNYSYLRWCLRSDINNAKKPNEFYISSTCIPHINAALSTEGCKAIPWRPSYSEPDENGKMILNYISYNEESKKDIIGPDIEMKRCPSCKKILSYFCFECGDHEICKKCFYQNNNMGSHNTFNKYDHGLENRKGNAESYKPKPKNMYSTGKIQRKNVDLISEEPQQNNNWE